MKRYIDTSFAIFTLSSSVQVLFCLCAASAQEECPPGPTGIVWPPGSKTQVLHLGGPSEESLDVVLLGDGFTSVSEFTSKAQAISDAILSFQPFSWYKDKINVRAVNVLSAEAGADDFRPTNENPPQPVICVDTAFDTKVGTDYLLDYANATLPNIATALEQAAIADPTFDADPGLLLMIVNIDTGNAIAQGSFAMIDVGLGFDGRVPHELGHIFIGLGHEYATQPKCYTKEFTAEPRSPNITLVDNSFSVKWNRHLGLEGISHFEGALDYLECIYRPTATECMMGTNISYPFCRVCRHDGFYPKINAMTGWVSPLIASGQGRAVAIDSQATTNALGETIWSNLENPSAGSDVWFCLASNKTGVYIGGVDFVLGTPEWRITKLTHGGTFLWSVTSSGLQGGGDPETAWGAVAEADFLYVVGSDASGTGGARIEKRNAESGAFVASNLYDPSPGSDTYYGVASDSTGLYVAGSESPAGNVQWVVRKLSKDDTFTSLWSSPATHNTVGTDEAYALGIDKSGVYIAGYETPNLAARWRIEKRDLASGDMLWDLPIDPHVNATDIATSIAIDADGIFVVGSDSSLGSSIWRIVKVDLDGDLAWTQTTDPIVFNGYPNGVAVDWAGIYVVGSDVTNNTWRIQHRSSRDGALIWDNQTTAVAGSSVPWAVAATRAGVYVAGSRGPESQLMKINAGAAEHTTGVYVVGSSPAASDTEWRIHKQTLADGAIIWEKVTSFSSSADQPTCVVALDDFIIVGGNEFSQNAGQWRCEKRRARDGTVQWSIPYDFSATASDQLNALAKDPNGTYVYAAGNDRASGSLQWRILKINVTNGNVAWSRSSNPPGTSESASGVAVGSNAIYVVGDDAQMVNTQWRLEKWDVAGNKLVEKQQNFSSNSDAAVAVAVNADAVFVAGYDGFYGVGNRQWLIQRRDFGLNHVWTIPWNPSSSNDQASAIGVVGSGTSTRVYVLGTDRYPGNVRWNLQVWNGDAVWLDEKIMDPSAYDDMPFGIAMTPETVLEGVKYVIVGSQGSVSSSTPRWRVHKFSLDEE